MKAMKWAALSAIVASLACGGDGESDSASVQPVSEAQDSVGSGGDAGTQVPASNSCHDNATSVRFINGCKASAAASHPEFSAGLAATYCTCLYSDLAATRSCAQIESTPIAQVAAAACSCNQKVGLTCSGKKPDTGTPAPAARPAPAPVADAGTPPPQPITYCTQDWEGGEACTESTAESKRQREAAAVKAAPEPSWSYQGCPSQQSYAELQAVAWLQVTSEKICMDECSPSGTTGYAYGDFWPKLFAEIRAAWGCTGNACQCFPPGPVNSECEVGNFFGNFSPSYQPLDCQAP